VSAESDLWTDAYLDAARTVGDPEADLAIATLFAESGQQARVIAGVIESLVRNAEPTPENLPPQLHAYLEMTSRVPPPVLPHVKTGENVFAEHGPEILCLLGCYSLPAAYGARRGAQVLYRTGQLTERAHHRLMVTSQMVLDVMGPGGLTARGRGIRTAQKVRLMHAAIRHLLLHDPHTPWDTADLGVPINQEDLAGTLMTFSYQILDGLNSSGISNLAGRPRLSVTIHWIRCMARNRKTIVRCLRWAVNRSMSRAQPIIAFSTHLWAVDFGMPRKSATFGGSSARIIAGGIPCANLGDAWSIIWSSACASALPSIDAAICRRSIVSVRIFAAAIVRGISSGRTPMR